MKQFIETEEHDKSTFRNTYSSGYTNTFFYERI